MLPSLIEEEAGDDSVFECDWSMNSRPVELLGKVGRRMSVAFNLHRFDRSPKQHRFVEITTPFEAYQSSHGGGPEDGRSTTKPEMRKTDKQKKQQGAGSLFTNFEDVRLTDEERVYLSAAALGDVGIIRQSLEESDNSTNLNVNCVDYMGRNALHLAVDSEHIENIELLMDKLKFECIEEALLHAISKGHSKIVRTIIEHPNYQAGEDKIKRMDFNNAFFRTTEKAQFSPDITPLILSAHYNNHEMIQMFLARNHTIEKPHSISCQCTDCQIKQDYDSLKRSRSRLNAYRALASPAYMALCSPDPITNTFELRQEMMKLAEIEKEFKLEYLMLVEQCMNFACQMMDLCRGTQEVEAVISENTEDDSDLRDPLGRLRIAIQNEEKKFIAHANCQQYLTSIWYGAETAFLQSWSLPKKISLSALATPLLPIFCILYIMLPNSKIARSMRCPAAKFATHALSHFLFLILLAAATFRIEVNATKPIKTSADFQKSTDPLEKKVESLMKEKLRSANYIITNVQICIVLFLVGLLYYEVRNVYFSGLKTYIMNAFNMLNMILLMLYTASYTLRIIVDMWVKKADKHFNVTTAARDALLNEDLLRFDEILLNITKAEESPYTVDQYNRYFMEPSRFKWDVHDPEIASDVLFALANVISFARTTYLMPAFEILGPLQIAFIRMLTDITRFMVLFLLVLVAFMVGLHNLYWYYGSQNIIVPSTMNNSTKSIPATEVFEGLRHTLYSLFWCMFGQISISSIPVKHPDKFENLYSDGMVDPKSTTALVEIVGMILFAVYHVIIIIVLVNMLIAMMSHSFEDIQEDCDVEWKFARTKLWLNYIDSGSTLPIPFNIIPTPKTMISGGKFLKTLFSSEKYTSTIQVRSTLYIKIRRENVCREHNIECLETSYKEIMQRLVRRYLFKLEREKAEEKSKEGEKKLKDICIRAEEAGGEGFGEDEHSDGPPDMRKRRRRGSVQGPSAHQLSQMLSQPQLDAIQRSQKILDMRLQNLQTQSEAANWAAGNAKIKEELEHMRMLISENQKALFSIIQAVHQIQEQVILLNSNMEQWVVGQASVQSKRMLHPDEGRSGIEKKGSTGSSGAGSTKAK